jgi:hypothetical protein
LRGQPIAFDRIEAYLNILQQQDSSKKKSQQRTKNSQTLHPEAKKYKNIVDGLVSLMAESDDKIFGIVKNELV